MKLITQKFSRSVLPNMTLMLLRIAMDVVRKLVVDMIDGIKTAAVTLHNLSNFFGFRDYTLQFFPHSCVCSYIIFFQKFRELILERHRDRSIGDLLVYNAH